jgi:hypothetical protein
VGESRGLASIALVVSLAAAAAGFAAPAEAATAAHTYYVSATGNDAAAGTSPATAWRTLRPVNSQALEGDTVLLQGGSTFVGPLNLGSDDDGVTIGSFGTGRARILGQGSAGVVVYDTRAVTVRSLDLAGDAAAYASTPGLNVYSDQPAGQRLSGLTISHVRAEGFKDGVAIGAANAGAGFAHVSIADVEAIGNRDDGVITYGPAFDASSPTYANADVRVVHTVANNNLGNPAEKVLNTGNGIVLGSVDGGSVERSSASGNGLRCVTSDGPAGIWTYDSRDIRIAYDTATGNRTGGAADGDGFDLDQNVSDSSLLHNQSSHNDGAGYLVFTGQANAANHNNIVRWNVSKGDAQKNNWYGGITLAGKVHAVTVRDNTVDTRASASRAPALAIRPGVSGAKIRGNRLRSASGQRAMVRS